MLSRSHEQTNDKDPGQAMLYRVLLIEDNDGDADLVREFLSGYATVTEARTLEQALSLAQRRVFDIALVDSSLPDAEGSTSIKAMIALGAFPVILLTGMDSPELGRTAAESGAEDYLLKGQFRAAQLRCAISSAVFRHESLIQYRTLLQESPDPIAIVNQAGMVLLGNAAAAAAFGMPEEGLVGVTLQFPPSGKDNAEISLPDGRVMEVRVSRVPWRGEAAFLAMFRDVTERIHLVKELSETNKRFAQLSIIDPLTGVLNRRGLEESLYRITLSADRTSGRAVALLFDCDDFKAINTVGGYTAGDATLQLVAKTISGGVRAALASVGRIGGDEFLVLLADTRFAEGLMVAERLREAISRSVLPLSAQGLSRLTVSVGVAAVPLGPTSLKEVISLAESALMSSKVGGKDRVTGGNNGVHGEGHSDTSVRGIVKEPSAIRVFAQPIIRQRDSALVGYELLYRGPVAGLFESPATFFAAARRDNILTAADLACLRRCREVSQHLAGRGRLHWNLFPSTLLETPIDEMVRLCSGISGLVLELSEQEFVGDPSMLLPVITRIRETGAILALDDVGFGRSSLETVLVLEPEVIKIDRCLVHGIAESAGTRRTLSRLLRSLEGLQVEVIAEGVETETEARTVAEMGIPFEQGFYWGRPEEVALPDE